MMAWLQAAGVLCGGAAGAACRFALGLTLANGWLPWGILTANVLGCLLMGVLQGVMRRLDRPFVVGYCLLGTGFLGGFTTFSSFAVDTILLWHDGHGTLAGLNVALNLFLGVGAVGAGYGLAMRFPRRA